MLLRFSCRPAVLQPHLVSKGLGFLSTLQSLVGARHDGHATIDGCTTSCCLITHGLHSTARHGGAQHGTAQHTQLLHPANKECLCTAVRTHAHTNTATRQGTAAVPNCTPSTVMWHTINPQSALNHYITHSWMACNIQQRCCGTQGSPLLQHPLVAHVPCCCRSAASYPSCYLRSPHTCETLLALHDGFVHVEAYLDGFCLRSNEHNPLLLTAPGKGGVF